MKNVLSENKEWRTLVEQRLSNLIEVEKKRKTVDSSDKDERRVKQKLNTGAVDSTEEKQAPAEGEPAEKIDE